MAIIFSRQVMERNFSGNPGALPAPAGAHTLALDLTAGTYTLQVDGVTVTAATVLAADDQWFTLTAGSLSPVLHVRDIGQVLEGSSPGIPFGQPFATRCLLASFGSLQTFLTGATRAMGN